MAALKFCNSRNYITYNGVQYDKLSTSYELFGQELHSAPIIVIIHALTGNSDVLSEDKGWWKELAGKNKLLDTEKYTLIAFNILGNGYDGVLIENYKDFTAKDIARLFYSSLKQLEINELFAIIGGSLGGGITWEMAALYPNLAKYIIPIASDWKATDWVIGVNAVQESILLNANKPLEDARKMAMLLYRTPQSFSAKFQRSKVINANEYNVESWLDYHGKKLEQRFELQAYLMMNHLLKTVDIASNSSNVAAVFANIKSTVVQIAINSDIYFVPDENIKTKKILDDLGIANQYYEIQAITGHDAFLIEHEQIINFLKNIFNYKK